jgi:hypothetical protein
MSELSRADIRKLVMEAMLSSSPGSSSSSSGGKTRKSEMKQFSESKSGQVVQREGRKIQSCSEAIKKVAEDQTGVMRETLDRIAEFVEKTGSCLSGMGSLSEGSSMCESLPTVSELKQLHKDIARLEK